MVNTVAILLAIVGIILSSPPKTVIAEESISTERQVSQAARRFRLAIYQRYRNQRVEYDRQNAIGQNNLQRWRQRGSRAADAERLVLWFHQTAQGMADPLVFEPFADKSQSSSSELSTAVSPEVVSPEGRPATQSDSSESGLSRRDQRLIEKGFAVYPEPPPVELPVAEPLTMQSSQRGDAWPIVNYQSTLTPRSVPLADFKPAPPERIASVISAEPRRAPIDVTVLEAKIRSYNVSVANLEHRLIDDEREWTVGRLEDAFRRYVELGQQQDLILLYFESIPPEFQQRCEPTTQTSAVRELLVQRIADAKQGSVGTGIEGERRRLNRILQAIHTKDQEHRHAN